MTKREDLVEFAGKAGLELGPRVHMKKVGIADDPLVTTADMKDYKFGSMNVQESLPVSYWLEGFLTSKPTVGEPLSLLRTNRNGVETLGLPMTSFLKDISEIKDGCQKIVTENSVYFLTYLEE